MHVTPSNVFRRILRSEALVYKSYFFQNSRSKELFDTRFSYNHCNFSRACLLVKMALKTVKWSISSVLRFLVSEPIILWTDTAFLFKESLVNIYFLISGAGLFGTLTIRLGECKLRNIEETTFPVVPDLGINVECSSCSEKLNFDREVYISWVKISLLHHWQFLRSVTEMHWHQIS